MAMQSTTHLIIGQQKHDVQDASQLQIFAAGLLCTLALPASAHGCCCFAHLRKSSHSHDRGRYFKHCVLRQRQGFQSMPKGAVVQTYRHIQVASQAAYTTRHGRPSLPAHHARVQRTLHTEAALRPICQQELVM